ncbi:SGNH/GDSL hydrolase family protein, partial [Candidatus Woesearchaeota archaeon]|nr:SGNH/GDSL hydrolase family protein [Candidatus Woesearchaeota archaeon]
LSRIFYENKSLDINNELEFSNMRLNANNLENDYYINQTTGLLMKTKENKIDLQKYTNFNINNFNQKNEYYYRIIILGDSFTAGSGLLDYNNNYQYVLAKSLNTKNNDKEFEILTFAMGGLNTYQEKILLENIVHIYNPNMTILQYCNNDIEQIRSPIKGVNDQYINSHTKYLIIDERIVPEFSIFSEKINRFLLSKSSFLRFISYKINIIKQNQGNDKELSFNSIKEMKKINEQINSSFQIIYFPLSLKDYNFCNDTLSNELIKLTSNLNITYNSMCNHTNINEIKSVLEGDNENGHYNKKGHLIAAKILKDEIINQIKYN